MKTQVFNQGGYCLRCGDLGVIDIAMGKMRKIKLCVVCWVGLAGCMDRDFEIFKNKDIDWLGELHKSDQAMENFKKQMFPPRKRSKK